MISQNIQTAYEEILLKTEDGTLELFADCDSEIAENPLWNVAEQTLYWRGHCGEIYRRKDDGSDPRNFQVENPGVGMIGGFTFTRENKLLLFAERGKIWEWSPGTRPELLAVVPGSCAGTLLNDAIASPSGDVYFGVLADYYFDPEKRSRSGMLCRWSREEGVSTVETNIGVTPNGMAFSPDRTKFYFGITEYGVYEYAFLPGNTLSGKKLLFETTPDGLTVDSSGCIWMANCCPLVTCYSSGGKLLKKYSFAPDIREISSVTFGGKDLSSLFITSMNYPYSGKYLGGKVFRFRPENVRGLPEFSAKGR